MLRLLFVNSKSRGVFVLGQPLEAAGCEACFLGRFLGGRDHWILTCVEVPKRRPWDSFLFRICSDLELGLQP